MTLKECYDALGGNYEDTVRRLYNEKLVEKFLFKFEEDPSFENLKKALEEEDLEAAFRAAHTLKGVAQNMGFDNLAESSSVLLFSLGVFKGGSFEHPLRNGTCRHKRRQTVSLQDHLPVDYCYLVFCISSARQT